MAATVKSNTFATNEPKVPLYSTSFPDNISATNLPCLLAGHAKGIIVGFLFTKSITCTASPTAYISSFEVLILLSTTIAPFSFTSMPASFAILLSGVTPMERIIMSVSISFPLFKTTFLPLSSILAGLSFNINFTPFSIK
ncbi:hypothetical protein SDC9_152294 [bioreactor metagenome]|uniref:Uncharacterized protein n=1 Tax=bioreactor metagenome TaxID=1076179 RepID=A0A645EX69_9ZZZZ